MTDFYITSKSIINNVKQNKDSKLMVFIFSMMLFIIYSPYFFLNFGYHNDYRIFEYKNNSFSLLTGYGETTHLIAIGRFLGAVLLNLHLMFFSNVASLAVGRLVSFFFVLILFFLFYNFLVKTCKIDNIFAICVSFLLFILPPIQLNILWITNFIPGILTLFYVFAAYKLQQKADITCFKDYSNIKKQCFNILAFIVYLTSFYIYPPMSMFFLVFIFSELIFSLPSEWCLFRFRTYNGIAFTLFSCLSYFLITKYLNLPVLALSSELYRKKIERLSLTGYNFNFSFNDIELRFKYLMQILSTAMDGWNATYDNYWIVILISSIFIFAILVWSLNLINSCKDKLKKIQMIEYIFVTIFFVPFVSCFPLLVSRISIDLAYRTLFPISSMYAIFFALFLWNLSRQIKTRFRVEFNLLLVSSFFIGILANINILNVALNVQAEREFVKRELFNKMNSSINEIQILLQKGKSTILDVPLKNDFRLMATSEAFFPGLIYEIMDEYGIEKNKIKVKFAQYPEFFTEQKEGRLVIDMRAAAYGVRIKGSKFLDFINGNVDYSGITGLSESEVHSDGTPTLRWALGPQTVLKSYYEPKKVVTLAVKFGNYIHAPALDVALEINGKVLKTYKALPSILIEDSIQFKAVPGVNEIIFKYSNWLHKNETKLSEDRNKDPRQLALIFFKLETSVSGNFDNISLNVSSK